MTPIHQNRIKSGSLFGDSNPLSASLSNGDYFRIRDFEYVQPLYDLAFLLEVEAIAKGAEIPKYRTFSLWRAGYSLDGYGTTIDRWLDGTSHDEDLDYVPSSRIRQYLTNVARTGTIPELRNYRAERFERCLRLRSVRGLGPSKIALTVGARSLSDEWFEQDLSNLAPNRGRIVELFEGENSGPWQTAHIVPPLLRFLNTVQECRTENLRWELSGVKDPFEPIIDPVTIAVSMSPEALAVTINKALRRERLFRRYSRQNGDDVRIRHQMGWGFSIRSGAAQLESKSISELANSLDPLANGFQGRLLADLHLHTAWSDGNASVNTMAAAIVASGLKYFAVTDHSRTAKLQGGLTPPLWLRQATALTLATPTCPMLHGIEVDILKDGTLDLPDSLLAAADIVVGSVHSNWTDDARENTDRLLRAIESGCIDILAHPTSAIIGKPGVPDYLRTPADVNWDEVFEKCASWRVALELNCFPSRLDLPLHLLRKAIDAGCAISLGSDAHARSHLLNLRFGSAALQRLSPKVVLNQLQYGELKEWIAQSRLMRIGLTRSTSVLGQEEFRFEPCTDSRKRMKARIQAPQNIPHGSKVIGIDLTAGDKATGVALLNECSVETCSLFSDEEILAYIRKHRPRIVSIDCPLGLPGGGTEIDPDAGIVRVAEQDLSSIGIPAYPALIDSMRNLTLRGIRLRRLISDLPHKPVVIESYPGAAQDILSIPRKQQGLDLLREGLRRLGLRGPGLETRSHDEMDAITSAIVGRYFEVGQFEPMGISSEAQLIVPKVPPLRFDNPPIICLAGKTGAGKSVVARYLSVFYGFHWVRTRNVIRELLIEDQSAPKHKRMFDRRVKPNDISEADLREFGAIVLDRYHQVPIRQRLAAMLVNEPKPIVLDSIRDLVDVEERIAETHPMLIWFIDANDAVILARLKNRKKFAEERIRSASPVDHTAAVIRSKAEYVIPNNGSFEELRWRVDDTLFDATVLLAE